MKTFAGLVAILLLGVVLGEDDIPKESRENDSNNGCENFAGALYNRVQKSLPKEDSFVISPLGVSSLLGTLFFAVGQTSRTEIANFLYPKCENSSELASRPPNPERKGAKLTMATVALVRRGVDVSKRFEDLAEKLGSYVFKTSFWDYSPYLQEFVHEKTYDTSFLAFDGLLHTRPSIESQLVFFNRVRYSAQFEQKFSLDGRNLVGRRVEALYANVPELKARVLGLRLLNTDSYLLIMLADQGASLRSVEQRLRTVDVRKLPGKLNTTLMDITLENFETHTYIYLRDILEKAGITTVFNNTAADLSAFSREVALDNVLVTTDIVLFENGMNTNTEAFVEQEPVLSEAVPGESLEFKAQNPLIYAVVDSKRVYLMGRKERTE